MPTAKIVIKRNKAQGAFDVQLTNLASAVGFAAAEDLAAEARRNLETGSGSTGLSTAGRDRAVRKNAGYPHVATGATLQSIQVTRSARGRGFTHRVSAGGAALELNNGRNPGIPVDVEKIASWMMTKGIASRGGSVPASLARRIAKQIELRGMAPTYFFTDAVNIVRRRVGAGRYNKKGGSR